MAIGPWGAMGIALGGAFMATAIGYGIWRTTHKENDEDWLNMSAEQANYMREVRERNMAEMAPVGRRYR